MLFTIFLFDSRLQGSYEAEHYNRAQLLHLANAHRMEWIARIKAMVSYWTINWKTVQERDIRDRYVAMLKLVDCSQPITE